VEDGDGAQEAIVTATLVPARGRYETVRAEVDGLAGEVLLGRECHVCHGELLVGDEVFVTRLRGESLENPHAVAHAPDCVDALLREARAT
jgi:hypothetical protein